MMTEQQMRLSDLTRGQFDPLDWEQLYMEAQQPQPIRLAQSLFAPADAMSPQARLRYKEATGEDINADKRVAPPPPTGYSRGEDDAMTADWKRRNLERQKEQLRNLLRRRGEG